MHWIGQHIYDKVSRFRNDVFFETDTVTFTSANADDPVITIQNTTDDNQAARFQFIKNRGAAGEDDDFIAELDFYGYNDAVAPEQQLYARIVAKIHDATNGEESGQLRLNVANHDGGNGQGLILTGGSVDNEVDVEIGFGAASLTTIAGNLALSGDTITSAADLNIVATGNDIAVDSDTFTITSSTADQPIIKLLNTTDDAQAGQLIFEKLRDDGGVASGTNLGEIWFKGEDSAGNTQNYAYIVGEIDVSTGGQESGQLVFGIANHDGGITTGLKLTGGSLNNEIDATIGLGAASVTTIAGTLTMGTTAAMTNAGLLTVGAQTGITACSNLVTVGTIGTGVWQGTAIDREYINTDAIDSSRIADDAVNSEHYADGSIDTAHIADDQVTFAKASGVTPNVFGSVIKLLPTDFMDNGDGGNTKFGIGYTDSAGTGYGMRVPNGATEMYAFVSIPEGMKATHVDIFDKTDLAIEVFEVQINATTMDSKGSGNCNTTLDITDVNATATNMLAIEVTTTATSDRVYGGTVTIAAQ